MERGVEKSVTDSSAISDYFGEQLLRPFTEVEQLSLAKTDVFGIAFSNRSGSTLLADLLYRRGLPIPPQVEILDPQLVQQVSKQEHKQTFTDYFVDTVLGWTDGNVCGFKFGVAQLDWLDNLGMLGQFKSLRLIHIFREDRVAQAVSLFVARMTGQWHHAMQAKLELKESDYSAEGIRNAYQTISNMESAISEYLAVHRPPVHHLSYEALLEDREEELQKCCDFLGWKGPPVNRAVENAVPPLISQHTHLNDYFAERFAREEGHVS
ncbi:Stf0 family sulfotransferase [Congregibacter sp.]|uniref:Stf0 family sulfotransferase n=1 Tax=Congregibacter sp. TaxID=2744308 RepID=UPI003F6D55D5